ncbi:hypothetical protein GWK47_024929 [Chionoecetes opilio]|uniref:Uncharacterized protein n=1 Tax=Chionoecetes opilio TaxID=41210 RepID=A0A8J5CJ11_CHIOP|nr:hypothetical protein GWK47_024929 [Chionoecetes opilio]
MVEIKRRKSFKEILQGKPEGGRSLLELTTVRWLSYNDRLGDTPPAESTGVVLEPIHQARWMARNLYSMKMFMFAEQLEYDEETVVKLERLNLFLGLFYTPMWMSSTLAADAPAKICSS